MKFFLFNFFLILVILYLCRASEDINLALKHKVKRAVNERSGRRPVKDKALFERVSGLKLNSKLLKKEFIYYRLETTKATMIKIVIQTTMAS